MLPAPDSSRWYLLEQGGKVWQFANSQSTSTKTMVLDISSKVAFNHTETGLLGMAFHPNFATNHFVYIFYTHTGTPITSYVSRFTSSADGLTFDPASEQVLLTVQKPFDNHNGGNLVFGPNDGYLYIGFGDGGGGDDTLHNAQNLKTLLGKLIRIDVNQAGVPYGIPADNPFLGGTLCKADQTASGAANPATCPEIYSSGLRNPWRWSFDTTTGKLWAGDVGQNAYEEVDLIEKGKNYGWSCREGLHANPNATDPACPITGYTDPIAEYTHSEGVSITGGYVYRGSAILGLVGQYVFADFGSGTIWSLNSNGQGGYNRVQLTTTTDGISSFAQGNDKELYYLSYNDGQIRSIQQGTTSGGAIPTQLSQTGCMSAGGQPASGLIPYAPNAPFWSDGAVKTRWMGVPDGQTIAFASDGDFTFPSGSVLVKNFKLSNQLIETRLFMRHPDGIWAGYTYEWNDAQTDATLVSSAGKQKIVGSQTWIYPSQAQCMQCHTSGAGFSLGLETAQLDGNFIYPNNRTANQMSTLSHIGMFASAAPTNVSALPDPFGSATIDNRARSYLHSNCSGCHRPGGGTPSSMDLRFTTALASTNACNAAPQAGDLGLTNAKIIAPGNAGSSVLASRINRRDQYAMPPVASAIADSNGVALITQWINSLASCN